LHQLESALINNYPFRSSSKKGKQKEVKLTFGQLTEKNWRQVQILNKACLPVNYGERFYQNIIPTPELTQLGTLHI
jgi:hypothetical protein